ncbi:hypothetical protein EAH78_12095 [Pseudomonas arsenicoxydans]|uniref:Uncharacterized protein n=1 Tax=Pseudomonas arsenicoxydans TaxID=702115 RepID=A0A502HY68_9PSED|nr:hypothetical protein EAH78_12095 [Pseudomonas arsenicoxydans]
MARELAPAGARSGPPLHPKRRGLLRSPTGASSLATGFRFPRDFLRWTGLPGMQGFSVFAYHGRLSRKRMRCHGEHSRTGQHNRIPGVVPRLVPAEENHFRLSAQQR